MPERIREEDNISPSSSPKKPDATIIEDLARKQEADLIAYKIIDNIAGRIFEVLINNELSDILDGRVQNIPEAEIDDEYIDIMNAIFPLAIDPVTGGVRQLSSALVERLNPRLHQIISCMSFGDDKYSISGISALETFCDIVNQELADRIPTNDVSSTSAKPLISGGHQQPIAVN